VSYQIETSQGRVFHVVIDTLAGAQFQARRLAEDHAEAIGGTIDYTADLDWYYVMNGHGGVVEVYMVITTGQ